MEKIIDIGDKKVKFAVNASFLLTYKAQFNKDILTDIMPIISDVLKNADDIWIDSEKLMPSSIGELLEGVYSLESVDLLNIIWAMAKTADKTIEEPSLWFAQFDEFPLFDISKELAPLFLNSLISKKKLMEIMKAKKVPNV